MRLAVLGCDVLFRELSYWASLSPHIIDINFVPRALHNEPDHLRDELQKRIDATPAGYDAIVLGMGLCSNATANLRAGSTPLVLPRAHDCMTLFLGSRARYDRRFAENPGTYHYTAGWIERGGANEERVTPASREAWDRTYGEYVQKYGEESAKYLMETLHSWYQHYTRAAFISMARCMPGAADYEGSSREIARGIALEHGWVFEEPDGDTRLFEGLLAATWDPDEYLVVPPGSKIVQSFGDEVVSHVPA